jgi:hypothetical protein
MAITQCIITKNFIEESNPENRIIAAKNLGEIAYKLFIYLESFPENFIHYERLNFVKNVNTNYKSADKALLTLIEKGYLIPDGDNNFIFISRPEENPRIWS